VRFGTTSAAIPERLGNIDATEAVQDGEGLRAATTETPSTKRIVGLTGAEWKVGELREGDRVGVVMAAGDKLVQEVRVLPRRNRR
jgi:hypothetical protein